MTYQDYFSRVCSSISRGYYANNPAIELGNLGIKGKVTNSEVEFPFMIAPTILPKLGVEYLEGDFIVPITTIDRDYYAVAKSSNPIFKQFFYDNLVYLAVTYRYGKNVKYWGNKGLIMYDDFTPLMLMTFTAKRDLNVTRRTELNIDKIRIYINPLIYAKDDLMAKAIRGKMLEELCSLKYNDSLLGDTRYINVRECAVVINGRFNAKDIEIIVDDKINDFIIIPKVPTINDTNGAIQNFISENADLIL